MGLGTDSMGELKLKKFISESSSLNCFFNRIGSIFSNFEKILSVSLLRQSIGLDIANRTFLWLFI
jgi:hypothetical protein